MNAQEPQDNWNRWKPGPPREPASRGSGADRRRTAELISRDIAHFAALATEIVRRGESRFFDDTVEGELVRRAGRNLVTEFWAALNVRLQQVADSLVECENDQV